MKIFDKNKLEKINDRQLRYKIVYSILFFLMGALVLKLFHLTIINGDDYRNKADNNRLKDVKITAPRGNIYDRNGKLLAGVKTSPAVQILKDEFNRLSKDEKVEKIEELTTILNKDGASWDTDDYFLGINYFVYSSDVDYFTELKSPKEKVLDIILENKLVEDILKLRIEKNSSSNFSYYIIKKVIRDLQLKGIYVPSDFFDVDSGDITFTKGDKYKEYAKDKDLSKGIYSHVANLVKDDKSIIRKILDQPLARKLVYEELKSKNLLKNIELRPLVDLNRYNLLLIKSELNKQNSKVTLETDAKDDFYNMVRKFTMDKLLSYVKVDKNGNKVIPAEVLLKKLEEKNIDANVEYTLVKDEKDKETVQFNYKDNEKKDIEPLTHLISIAEENNLLYDFVLSDDIKFVAQEVNTENNIILRISITSKSFDYVYNINRTEIKNRYKIKEDYTAESLFSTLKKTYSIDNLDDYIAYSYLVLNRKVELQGDKAYIPITLTYGISEPCISHIKEKFENNNGFTVSMEPIRYYPNGELASHILGYIGKISQQDEIDKYTKDKGYSSDSFIGKTGVEESQEVSLKGKDGFKKVMVDNRGNRTETISETQAVPGKNVYLSIDSNLQKVAEESLKNTLESIRNGSEYKSKWGSYTPHERHRNATSGAVVVLDVKTGKVLALASYPSYDPNLFVTGISNSDWISLFPEDPRDFLAPRPLYNIATQSVSQPGSTFKLASALTALEKGLNPNENINCQGIMDVGDTKFGCWIWNQYQRTHGNENLRTALRDSCNYYFYALALGENPKSNKKTGTKITIEDLSKTVKELGLGERTGIEINVPRESKGVVPDSNTKKSLTKIMLKNKLEKEIEKYILDDKNKEDYDFNKIIDTIVNWTEEESVPSRTEVIERLKQMELNAEEPIGNSKVSLADMIKFDYLNQASWSNADSLNTVIGQGQNAYTPIQMARYMAMISNGGQKVKTSVIEKIVSYDNKTVSFQNNPETEKSSFNPQNLKYILEGMNMASKTSENAKIFKNLPIEIGIKTGTAQKSGTNPVTGQAYDNYAWNVSFAPYNNPEIAIATVIFQGGAGAFCGPIVRDIVGQYIDNKAESGQNVQSDKQNDNNSENNDNLIGD